MNSAASAPLPLRNVLIEVRQVQSHEASYSALQSGGRVRIDGTGAVDMQGRLRAQQGQATQSDRAAQQVLVLNGRSARIALNLSTPMRVVQSYVRNGALVVVPSTLIWQAATGFSATPRWESGNSAELEVSTQQAPAMAAGVAHTGGMSGGQASSTLVLPLATWVTLAQSDTESDQTRADLGGHVSADSHQRSEVQVRLTLP